MTEDMIKAKLNEAFSPDYLEVINESHRHQVPPNSETHFKVVMSSAKFEGLMLVRRHQGVYKVLAEELTSGVHALALHLYTPSEWGLTQQAPQSPNCAGRREEQIG